MNKEIVDLRQQLIDHKLYKNLNTIGDIRILMESHVFAAWDFMSLVKALQISLTTISVPWTPPRNAKLSRFINEIVWAEESDLNELGEPKSHFEMYLDAMQQLGANTTEIDAFIAVIKNGTDVFEGLELLRIDRRVVDFMKFTFDVIKTNKIHLVASAFTFGREELIPDLFLSILEKYDADEKQSSKLAYYLKRHIELDGDEHGPIALKMVTILCGDDEESREESQKIAVQALKHRILLWDAISDSIEQSHEPSKSLAIA
jgi:hypothetical protein